MLQGCRTLRPNVHGDFFHFSKNLVIVISCIRLAATRSARLQAEPFQHTIGQDMSRRPEVSALVTAAASLAEHAMPFGDAKNF